jgi:hypothetical protein
MLWKSELPIEVRDQLSPEELDMLINDLDDAVQTVCEQYGVEI